MAVTVPNDDVIAFRLRAQHLDNRQDEDGLLEATGACGVQNSPPGSARLALHARVQGMTADRLENAVGDKSLLQSWCMRGAPFYIPTADAPVFTTGVLPPTEEAMRQFVLGAGPTVDKVGLTVTEAVDLTEAEIGAVLTGRRLAIDELGAELAQRIAGRLPSEQRTVWEEEGPHTAGQPIGEAVVHFCVRILTLRGVVCFAPRVGNKAPFVLVEEWLGQPIPETDPRTARAELLRRYLRCYGPSTRADFAVWLGVRTQDADHWWSLIEDEMTEVEFRRAAWVLTEDLDALRSPPAVRGVRLLPPRDPYTQLRDRETIVPPAYHREVWKKVGDPGTVMIDGAIVGIWRPRKNGRRLSITVATFEALSDRDQQRVQAEVEQIAPLRGASTAVTEFETA